MQLLCYGFPWDGHLIRIASAVRRATVGDEIRIVTDADHMVPDMRAFAHITGNRIVGIRGQETLIVDMEKGPNSIYSARSGGTYGNQQSWVIVLEVLATNRLVPKADSYP